LNFAKARESAGLTLAESARRLGVTPAAICQWESGKTFPDGRRLTQIAGVYGTTVDELLREEDIDAEGTP
jgi:transcriptional regulator with XRE-family HTH domain